VNWAFVAGLPPDPITGVILPQIRWLYDDPYTIDPQTGFDDVGAQDIYNIGLSGDDSWVIAEAAHLDKWGDPRELIRNPLTSFTGGGRTLVF
jgi:hypothetical protein